MSSAALTHAQKVAAARRKAQEMKAAAAEKRAAQEKRKLHEAENGGGGDADPSDVLVPGEHSLTLIDWDDTLFPTSDWKDRIEEGATHPPRASEKSALSEAISSLIRTLQQHGDVKMVTHGTKGWYEHSSRVLLPETKALLDSLEHRYRDSCGGKYMHKKRAGEKYTTDIGVEVDNYGEWFKTDMFFHFISERKQAVKWDETHLPQKVVLPKQVLIIGDGRAEKRSYDEHGNQARIYANRPGHSAVARVGLKGVFLKDAPSYDELLLQLRWATAQIGCSFLPANDSRMMVWDLTGFPEWVCAIKAGANNYQPVGRGSVIDDVGTVPQVAPGAEAGIGAGTAAGAEGEARMDDEAAEEERALQEAIMLSLR